MCKYHPSIILIKSKVDNQNKFSFKPVALSDIVKEIKNINPNKSSTKDSIPPKIFRKSSEATANILQKLLNESLDTGTFPGNMKLADRTPTFIKRLRLIIVQSVFYLLCQNFLKWLCRNK